MIAAVLCARNQRNGGMYSVDLAARPFFSGIDLPHILCRSQGKSEWGVHRYHRVRAWEDLKDFDALVIWGDWQAHPKFGAEDYPSAERKYEGEKSHTAALLRWRQIYQWCGANINDRRPMITVGCSFVGLEDALESAPAREAFSTYMNRSRLIIPRDPLSCETLVRLFPGSERKITKGGVDPALLADLPLSSRLKRPSRTFAYCFDREVKSRDRELVRRVRELSGARPVFIDWNKRRWPRRLSHAKFVANIEAIRWADFCLTDLYHLTVNAVNLSVPVIALGQAGKSETVTTNSAKKRVLLERFALPDLYVEVDNSLHSSLERAVAAIASKSTMSDRLALVRDQILAARRTTAQAVHACLTTNV